VKLFGIPIKIEPAFFIIVAFLGMGHWTSSILLVEWVLVVIVSVLLHEFGHAFAARVFGLSPQIRLYAMGGQTFWLDEIEISPLKHLIISLAGPLAGFLLGGLVFLSALFFLQPDSSDLVQVTYLDLIWVNVGWGVFNLLPMLPLDGGQVLTSLEAWLLRRKDKIVSHALSLLVALAIAGWAFSRRWTWVVFLGIWFAYINGSFLYQKFQEHRDRNLEDDLNEIRDAVNRGEHDRALNLIGQVERHARSPEMKRQTAYLRVMAHVKQNNFAQAEDELGRFTALFGESSYLQGTVLFLKGDTDAALPHLQDHFEQAPDQQVGMMIYKCLIAKKSFAGALNFIRHPALAEASWELLVDLQTEAFNHGAFEISAEAGQLACEEKADPKVAYNVACAFSRNGNLTEALAWAHRAIDLGFDDKDALRNDPDLEQLRPLPEFTELKKKFESRPAE
jgi:Zn-dependent protease